jgi:hypothetical protein
MENTKPVPYKDWPWWVKLITSPMHKKIDPLKSLGGTMIIIVLLIWDILAFFFERNPSAHRNYLILLLLVAILTNIWQIAGTLWIEKNSRWELINIGIVKRIFMILLTLLIILIPFILYILLDTGIL